MNGANLLRHESSDEITRVTYGDVVDHGITRVTYGDVADQLFFVERIEAYRLAQLHMAIRDSKTWGEFKDRIHREYFSDVMERLEENEAVSYLEYHGEAVKECPELDEDEIRGRFLALPVGERLPVDADPFDRNLVPDPWESSWPTWPPADMVTWVPKEIQEEFGQYVCPMHDLEYLYFDPEQEEEVVGALEAHGFKCFRDDSLVNLAHGC